MVRHFFFIFFSSFLILRQIIQNQNLELLLRIKHSRCVTNEFRRIHMGYSMREERKRRTQNNLWLVKSYELH